MNYYNLVSDQFTGLNAITLPGTLCDSLVLLSVVLEQETEFDPTEIMTDTGAYTDVIFGIFWLLGYQFSPRIADVGGARFWRVDPAGDYGPSTSWPRTGRRRASSPSTGTTCCAWPDRSSWVSCRSAG